MCESEPAATSAVAEPEVTRDGGRARAHAHRRRKVAKAAGGVRLGYVGGGATRRVLQPARMINERRRFAARDASRGGGGFYLIS